MAILYLDTRNRCLTPETAAFLESVHQYNWLHPDDRMDCVYELYGTTRTATDVAVLANHLGAENVIPVGSVEFVRDFCTSILGLPPVKALNVPPELRCLLYLHRLVWDDQTPAELEALYKQYGDLLVKPGKSPKLFEMTKYTGKETFPVGESLFVSQPIPQKIIGEWRVFCLNGKIRSIHPYGPLESWEMPDKDLVQEMALQVNRHSCPSFALDVAVLDGDAATLDNCPPDRTNTTVIEVHPFISCGLYGFEGPDVPKMAIVAWRHHVRTSKEV